MKALIWKEVREMSVPVGKRHWRTVALGLALFVVALPAFFMGVKYLGEPTAADIHEIAESQTSPDGEWIAFTDRTRASRRKGSRLWLKARDGTGLKCISRRPVASFTWSSDSNRLLISWGHRYAQGFLFPSQEGFWLWQYNVSKARLVRLGVCQEELVDSPLAQATRGRCGASPGASQAAEVISP